MSVLDCNLFLSQNEKVLYNCTVWRNGGGIGQNIWF